jgi:hypothetical protein
MFNSRLHNKANFLDGFSKLNLPHFPSSISAFKILRKENEQEENPNAVEDEAV